MGDSASSVAKGREFERRIGALFEDHGYDVRLNAIREGQSGVRHEIDVLATRADALTQSSTFIECKAWRARIPKDVVAKARYVMQDAGLNHGIIVTLEGWTVSAETAAREAGIELWGPNELAERLGNQAVVGLRAAPVREAQGFAVGVAEAEVARRIDREAGGLLGVRRKEIVRRGLLWMPWHLLQVSISSEKGSFKKRVVSRRAYNMYDALDGALVRALPDNPATEPVDVSAGSLAVELKPGAISSALGDALTKYRTVSTDAARKRHAQRLAALGIELPLSAVAVEAQTTIYDPLWVAIVRDRSGERVVAASARAKRPPDQNLSTLLTGRLAAVADALR